MRISRPLNNDWLFSQGIIQDKLKSSFINYIHIDLPHQVCLLDNHYINSESYQGDYTYVKDVLIPPFKPTEDIFLTFEGVQVQCKVFINGIELIHHKGGYLPFSVPLNDAVQPETTARIIVEVDTREDEKIPPFGNVVDYLSYGGIYREVHIDILPKERIHSLYVATTKQHHSNLHLEINHSQKDTPGLVKASLFDSKNIEVWSKTHSALSPKMDIPFSDFNPRLWSLEDPYLYHLKVQLFKDGQLIDEVEQKVGFRTISFTENGFYLNEKKVKIHGLNRHQSYPYVGDAMPQSLQEEDARILKEELGVNMVRTSHYPQSTHFLDACDRLGLLVMEEIPGWQHIGDEAWKQHTLANVSSMILRDRHHPAIVLWGVRINESTDDHSLYQQTNALAHHLDPSRPTGGVRNFKNSEFLEDVFTYNDFSHNGSNPGLVNPKKMVSSKTPYLITEFNGHMFPTRRSDSAIHLQEHALRHWKVIHDSHLYPQLSGVLGWCMFDYPTHVQFGHPDRMCYHGVLDFHREPKLAAAVYGSSCTRKPILEASTSMNPGAYPATILTDFYVFTNCDSIKVLRNGILIKEYFKPLDGLIHVSDLIGNQLEKMEGFTSKDSERLKSIFKKISQKGVEGLPLFDKLLMVYLMKRYQLTLKEGARLYTTYMAQWGSKPTEYKVRGFIGTENVIERTLGPSFPSRLVCHLSHQTLTEQGTFQVARLSVRVLDSNGNIATEDNSVVSLKIEGRAQIIGPTSLALVGGTSAFYLKSIHQSGGISITVNHPTLKEWTGSLNIKVLD